jgi:aminoglycoside phosphotransferase (APT) family kinase protein
LVRGGEIPLVLVHGDFAPWNLKFQEDGQIAAIDWEDAQLKGFPLWDLCHFFLMQGHLFRETTPVKEMATSPLVQNYIQRMGLDHNAFIALLLVYILWRVFGRENMNSSDGYKIYLLKLIPAVLAI